MTYTYTFFTMTKKFNETMFKKVLCKCGYSWNTKSKLSYVSCPSCLRKVDINGSLLKS